FHIDRELSDKDSLYISSLGYQEKVIEASGFKDSIIYLHSEDIILDEVVLLNTSYTADQIMERVLDSLMVNNQSGYSNQRIFYRDSDVNGFNQFEVDVKQSTIEEFNQEFANQIVEQIP